MSLTVEKAQKDLFGTDINLFAPPINGRFQRISGIDNLKKAVKALLETSEGEMLFYEHMGADVQQYVHMHIDDIVLIAPARMKRIIEEQEPRVKQVNVTAIGNQPEKYVDFNIEIYPKGYGIPVDMSYRLKLARTEGL